MTQSKTSWGSPSDAIAQDPSYLAAIFRTLRQPVLVLHDDLSVELANEAFYSTFDVDADATLGRKIYYLGNGQWDIPRLRRLLEHILPSSGEVRDYRVEHDFEQIGRRTMILNGYRMQRRGHDDRILLSIDDITEREQVQRALEGQKEYAEKIVDASRDPLLILGPDLRVQSANQTFYDRFEVKPADTLGRLVYELGDGQWDIPRLRELLEQILPRNEALDGFRVEHAFGSIGPRVLVLNARKVDHLQCILLAIEDQTEIRAESRLAPATSEHRYRNLFEAMRQGYVEFELIRDAAGRVTDYLMLAANPQYERLTGIPVKDAIGRRARDIVAELDPFWWQTFERIARTGQSEQFEHEQPSLGRWFGIQAYHLGDDRLAVIYDDISDRKRAEAALREGGERQSFLLGLSDRLRSLSDAGRIRVEACRLLGEYLGASHVCFVEYDHAAGCGSVSDEFSADGKDGLAGRYPFDDFHSTFERLAGGKTWTVPDVARDDALAPQERTFYLAQRLMAWTDVPLVQGGLLQGALCVVQCEPRDWSAHEIQLIEETTERLWAAFQRARSEQALRESEARFRQFGDNSADALWIVDAATGQLEYLSPAFESIWGESRERVLADIGRWAELLHPDDRERAAKAMPRAAAGEPYQVTYRIIRPSDGEIRVIQDTGFPILGPQGQVERIGGVAQDVTEQQHAEELLRESEERLRNAIDVGMLGLWDWNLETGEIHWSDRHFRMEGYEVDEVVPSYETWSERLHPEDRAKTESALLAAQESGSEYAQEFRVIHPDGSVRWLYSRGRFYYDEAGRPLRMIGAMTDTTDRRQLDEHQKVLIAELQHRTINLIGVVQSIAERTARGSSGIDDFRGRFRSRLGALTRVQRLLSRLDEHDRVSFDELLETELAAMSSDPSRYRLEGPRDVLLRSSSVQTLAMALHELATNAVKYGALGQASGRLAVTWSRVAAEDGDEPWLSIDWRESGVRMPGAVPARGTGQGRDLIDRALPYQLNARTTYELGPDGVHCTILIPVSKRKQTEG